MDFKTRLDRALLEFEKPELLKEKINRLKDISFDVYEKKFDAIVVFDSRILYPPEFIFGLRPGDLYVVQGILSDVGTVMPSIEFGVNYYNCHKIIVALMQDEISKNEKIAKSFKKGIESHFEKIDDIEVVTGVLDIESKKYNIL